MAKMQLRDLIDAGAATLAPRSSSARLDAELLLALALEKPRSFLFAWPESEASDGIRKRFEEYIARRVGGEPLAYISGWREFWSIPLRVDHNVLVPRPETERLVELALARLPESQPLRVADIGTGSGAIAIAIACERPHANVVATDISEDALAVASANAARLDIANVEFRCGNLCEPLYGGAFDLIVSNPPYVESGDVRLYTTDIAAEPLSALDGGADGLDLLARLAETCSECLVDGATLLMEHGEEQGPAVARMLHEAGYADVATWQDHLQLDRVTGAKACADTQRVAVRNGHSHRSYLPC